MKVLFLSFVCLQLLFACSEEISHDKLIEKTDSIPFHNSVSYGTAENGVVWFQKRWKTKEDWFGLKDSVFVEFKDFRKKPPIIHRTYYRQAIPRKFIVEKIQGDTHFREFYFYNDSLKVERVVSEKLNDEPEEIRIYPRKYIYDGTHLKSAIYKMRRLDGQTAIVHEEYAPDGLLKTKFEKTKNDSIFIIYRDNSIIEVAYGSNLKTIHKDVIRAYSTIFSSRTDIYDLVSGKRLMTIHRSPDTYYQPSRYWFIDCQTDDTVCVTRWWGK